MVDEKWFDDDYLIINEAIFLSEITSYRLRSCLCSCVSVDDCHPLRCIRIPFPEFAGVFQIVLRRTLNLQTMEKAFQTGIVVTTTFGAHAAN